MADGGLYLGAGAGTAITSTAAELNLLDGVTMVGTATLATGTYVGNDSVNRAIAHGMAGAPTIIFITAGNLFYRLPPGDTANIFGMSDTVNSKLAVTARDATNFYVGNATSYHNSANASGNTYYWFAIRA